MDYSDDERRQALDVIDKFGESEARDELGLGTVRDALADALFPGTSTIQTRAKYFLFIPWIYLSIEKYKRSSNEVASVARREEVKLIKALIEDNDEFGIGIIGRDAQEKLKRLASNVYWQGLGRWKIRTFDGSQEVYHRYVDQYYRLSGSRNLVKTDDGDVIADAVPRNWHGGIPPAPANFPDKASFELTRLEAEYLRDRIAIACPDTLLRYLVLRDEPFEPVDFPWELDFLDNLHAGLRNILNHAQHFSEAVHGAALLYNLMLAELIGSEEYQQRYTAMLADWWVLLESHRAELLEWDRTEFWNMVSRFGRIPGRTQGFAEQWIEVVMSTLHSDGALERVVSSGTVRRVIERRESSLKRQRARLTNKRARELWRGDSGTAQLSFRWGTAQTIVLDILNGLQKGK